MRSRSRLRHFNLGGVAASKRGLELNRVVDASKIGEKTFLIDSGCSSLQFFEEGNIDGKKYNINYYMKKLIKRITRVSK